jgi:protocatechuate 3,4-dioxygenase beta subunit
VLALWLSTTSCANKSGPFTSPIDGPDGLTDLPADIGWQDTSPGWSMEGEKLLLTGVIRHADGTPAREVVLYYYQTNPEGRYVHDPRQPRSMSPNELGQTHGFVRGWVRTGDDGRYAIRTVRPGSYPGSAEPAHVHATLQEPGRAAYYIDDFVFDDDPLLTSARRERMENRAGSGVLRLERGDGLAVGERDLYLGLNVPGHPGKHDPRGTSGRKVGEDVLSFAPHHAFGPDRGTRTCPVCKYGKALGILYFVGNRPDWSDVRRWLAFLEAESARRGERLKVYFIYGNEHGYDQSARERELDELGRELGLKHLALTFVPSFTDEESDVALNRVDPQAQNTFLLYRKSRIFEKAVDLAAKEESFRWISTALDAAEAG